MPEQEWEMYFRAGLFGILVAFVVTLPTLIGLLVLWVLY